MDKIIGIVCLEWKYFLFCLLKIRINVIEFQSKYWFFKKKISVLDFHDFQTIPINVMEISFK